MNNLDNKKIGSYKNSSINILKESSEKICAYFTKIWNEQVIMQKKIPKWIKTGWYYFNFEKRRFYTGKKL